jgi:hypothetical protein
VAERGRQQRRENHIPLHVRKINKGHCKAVPVYGEATDAGDCSVDRRTGATLVLKSGDWGTQKFALVRDADVAAELAQEG